MEEQKLEGLPLFEFSIFLQNLMAPLHVVELFFFCITNTPLFCIDTILGTPYQYVCKEVYGGFHTTYELYKDGKV